LESGVGPEEEEKEEQKVPMENQIEEEKREVPESSN